MALMPPTHPRIALEHLKEVQRVAAEHGYEFDIVVDVDARQRHVYLAPEGVHVTDSVRVGDVTRGKYYEHLHEMFAGGYISQEELYARLDAAFAAPTKDQLEYLVRDLPKMKEKVTNQQHPADRFLFSGRFDWSSISVISGVCAVISFLPPYSSANLVSFVILLSISFGAWLLHKK